MSTRATVTAALFALLFQLAPPACPQAGPVSLYVVADSGISPFNQTVGGASVDLPPGTAWQLLLVAPVNQNGPNFVVVSPSSGTGPSTTSIGVNQNIVPFLPPRTYGLSVFFGVPGQPTSSRAAVDVQLTVAPPPPPNVTSVVSAASLQPQISPGELISIFGANIGTPPISGQYSDAGLYPTTLGNTTVTIGGTLAPLLYVSTTQINALVPFEVAGQISANVIVTHDDVAAPAVSVAIVDTSPAIFTSTGTGKGQGAIQNPTGPTSSVPNSANNPAPVGSVVVIYATGGGVLAPSLSDPPEPAPQDGSVIIGPAHGPIAPVSLTIGGQPAQVQYVGSAPYEVAGILQINAVIPQGTGSGAQPVVLKIGANDNSAQQVTVAVK